jgi:hypothetical protein
MKDFLDHQPPATPLACMLECSVHLARLQHRSLVALACILLRARKRLGWLLLLQAGAGAGAGSPAACSAAAS